MPSAEGPFLKSTPWIRAMRHGLPTLICVAGIVIGVSVHDHEFGLEIAILLIAAGTSLWLMSFLWRVGVESDKDRDKEQAARAYFDEHGRWPGE